MKYFGYTRVSTERQVVHGVSLDAQVAKIKEYVAFKDPGQSVAMFEDAGVSGSSTKGRPGLAAALDAVHRSKGTLVVYSLSRLARSTADASSIAAMLEKKGCGFVSLSESFDTTTAAGKVFFTMIAAFAQFERDLCSERTTSALRHMRASGRRISCRIPYGFDLAPDKKMLVRNELEQETLTTIRELRANGHSLREIARHLQASGIRTKLGRPFWSPETISVILRRGPHEI